MDDQDIVRCEYCEEEKPIKTSYFKDEIGFYEMQLCDDCFEKITKK